MTTKSLTGSAYWAQQGANAMRALAQSLDEAGRHGSAAAQRMQAEHCEHYLEVQGQRDAAAPDMLEALRQAYLTLECRPDAQRTAAIVKAALDKATA